MPVTYTKDGPWGTGKSAPLSEDEFNDNFWSLVGDGSDLSAALAAAAAAQAVADGKIQTFFAASAPVNASAGDLWFNTADNNKLYRWSGTAWVEVFDARIATALAAAGDAQSTADGKITTFYQDAEPATGMGVGDLWVDTNDSNKLYRYSGSAWVSARDAGIATAIADAAAAQAAADGKIQTFYQDGAPSSGMAEGDLWIDTNDGNKLYIYASSAWTAAQDTSIGTAITNAATAQATADGKVTTFYAVEGSPPTAEGAGDLWYQTDTKLTKRWNGATWQAVASYNIGALADLNEVGTAQIAAGSTTEITVLSLKPLHLIDVLAVAVERGYCHTQFSGIPPVTDSIGILAECVASLHAATFPTSRPVFGAASVNSGEVRTYGTFTTSQPQTFGATADIVDSGQDFTAAGVTTADGMFVPTVVDDEVVWAYVGYPTVIGTTTMTINRHGTTDEVGGIGTSYLIMKNCHSQVDGDVPMMVESQAGIPFTSPWIQVAFSLGPLQPFREADDLWLFSLGYDDETIGGQYMTISNRVVKIINLKR